MTTTRVAKTVRWDPGVLQLGLKLAQQMYGSEKRLGYVCDDAIRLLHVQQTQTKEAKNYLSNVENQVVRSLEKRLEAIGRRATEVIDNHLKQAQESNRPLLVRQTRESIYASLAMEELCVRAIPNYKDKVEPKLNKEVTTRMKRKLTRDGDEEGASFEEENAKLREEIESLKRQKAELAERLDKTQSIRDAAARVQEENKKLKAHIDEVKQEAVKQKREKESLEAWTRGLITHMKNEYSRMKSNEKLIEEYTSANPQPEGL